MPDWYPYFKVAPVLGIKPWEAAGFSYEGVHPGDIPICWREWAYDLLRSEAKAKAAAIERASKP